MASFKEMISLERALEQISEWRSSGLSVVFTNGCFDILHAGHAAYLTEARRLGDRLVIGLNSDNSVRRLKGPNRPVCSEIDRAALLSALRAVDAVILFDEDTPEKLIGTLLPDILVKGADWKVSDIAGADAVIRKGGKVITIPLLEGRSTSGIIERIVSLHCQSTPCGETR